MKRHIILFASLLFLGAGCFGGSAVGGASDGGIFTTSTSGEEWAQAVLVPSEKGIGTLATTDVLNLAFDPQDKEFMYVSTRDNGMLYSDNAGLAWRQPRTPALREGLVFETAVDPKDVCTVYVAKGNRLYKSVDCMRSFDSETYVDSRAGVKVERIAVDWYNQGALWIGLSNGDVLRSTNGGTTWSTSLKMGAEISDIAISNVDSRNVLVSTYSAGMQRTVDSGETWVKVDTSVEKKALGGSEKVFNLVQTKNASTLLAATQYGLIFSENFGESWQVIKLLTAPGEVTIRAIGMDENNSQILYYATASTFYRSLDGGHTWETEQLPTTRIPRVMLVDPVNSSVLYIGVANPIK